MAYNGEALSNQKYDLLDSIIEEVHIECVKIDRDGEKKVLVQRFQKVIASFIETMKNVDPVFKQVYNKIGYTGSFYDGLRVGEATEYDLNIILKLNLDLKTEKKGTTPGFIGIRVLNYADNCDKTIKDWIVSDLLQPIRVKQWLEGVVSKTVRSISNTIDDCKVNVTKSGPAMTLKVTTKTNPAKEICIDLVPVIQFPSSQWPNIPRKPKKLLNGSYEKEWFAVPKRSDTWRLSFPIHEQHMIKHLNYLKYTLRLLKKVRDAFSIDKVASYYIKTLFLWEVDKMRDPTLWSNRKGRLFMHMLLRFKDALEQKNIPFYWDEKSNMIAECKDDYIRNSFGKLKNFINDIDKRVETKDRDELRRYIRMQLIERSNGIQRDRTDNHRPSVQVQPEQQAPAQEKSSCCLQ